MFYNFLMRLSFFFFLDKIEILFWPNLSVYVCKILS